MAGKDAILCLETGDRLFRRDSDGVATAEAAGDLFGDYIPDKVIRPGKKLAALPVKDRA